MTVKLTPAARRENLLAVIAQLDRPQASAIALAEAGDVDGAILQALAATIAGPLRADLMKAVAALAPAVAAEHAATDDAKREAAAKQAQVGAERDKINRRFNHEGNAQRLMSEFLRQRNTLGATPPSEIWWATAGKPFCRPGDRESDEPDFLVTDEIAFNRFLARVSRDYNRWRDHGGHDDEIHNSMRATPASPMLLRAG